MKSIALIFALATTACGIDGSKLAADSTLKDQGTGTDTGTATSVATSPAASGTTVHVQTTTTTTVDVSTGNQPDSAGNAPVTAPATSTELTFADGAYGWFFADGSFDRGSELVQGEQAPAYCRFEAPDCEGRCVIDSLPAKDSLFTNGTAYFRAWETETDMGRLVVASVWQGGHCEAAVKTLAHSYSPAHSWVLDAGDSTVPSQHLAQ